MSGVILERHSGRAGLSREDDAPARSAAGLDAVETLWE